MAIFVPPVCDHKICQVVVGGSKEAEWLPRSFKGMSEPHRRFRHRHGRHGRREFLNMFKTVAQRSPRRLVAQRWLKGGRREAQALPWLQKGGTRIAVVAEWRHNGRPMVAR